jgi:hypothetical protein
VAAKLGLALGSGVGDGLAGSADGVATGTDAGATDGDADADADGAGVGPVDGGVSTPCGADPLHATTTSATVAARTPNRRLCITNHPPLGAMVGHAPPPVVGRFRPLASPTPIRRDDSR